MSSVSQVLCQVASELPGGGLVQQMLVRESLLAPTPAGILSRPSLWGLPSPK